MKKVLLFAVMCSMTLVSSGSFVNVASAHYANVSACESITLVIGSDTAVLTPGPINLAGNGTFSVPAGTYTVTWSDDFVVENVVVPSCSTDDTPPPVDVCPDVTGNQSEGPCINNSCLAPSTWIVETQTCDAPPIVDVPPPPVDVCPNVTGNQSEGPCIDNSCLAPSTWIVETQTCDAPPIVDVCPNDVGIQISLDQCTSSEIDSDDPSRFTLQITTSGNGGGIILANGIHCNTNSTAEENDCQEIYDEGTNINIFVTPDENSNFNDTWSTILGNPGSCTNNNASCQLTLTENTTLNAHFGLNGGGGGGNNTDLNSSSNNNGGGGGGGTSGSRSTSIPIGEVLGVEDSCGIYVDKFLRVGYQNDADTVKKVQQFLNDYMRAGLVLDGNYGLKTEKAVRNFQLAYTDRVLAPWKIADPTGIFYLTTQTEVNNIICPTLKLPIPKNLIPWSTNPTQVPPKRK